MTDDLIPPEPDPRAPEPAVGPEQPSSNGAGTAGAKRIAVRSGLAHRRNPVLATLRDIATGTRRLLFRDPLALFLLLASIGLAVAFFTLLGAIQPSSLGRQVPISTVQALASRHEIHDAVVLDHDDRVELHTTTAAPRVAADGALPSPTTTTTIVKGKHGKRARSTTTVVRAAGRGRHAAPVGVVSVIRRADPAAAQGTHRQRRDRRRRSAVEQADQGDQSSSS